MTRRLSLTLAVTLALAGCAAPGGPAPAVVAPATTPLLAVAAYRVLGAESGPSGALSVLGVSPPVSGMSIRGDRFMVRPDTNEVMRLGADGTLASWGGLGAEPGRFNRPESLAVSFEHVYVADTGNHRVQVFGFDGAPQAQWGAFGVRPGQFVHPRAVEVLANGQVVVTDDFRVQYFDSNGAFLVALPIALAPTLAASADGEAQAREAAIAQLDALKNQLAQDAGALEAQGDAAVEAYRTAMRDALARFVTANATTGAPFAGAVVKAALGQAIEGALPVKHVAAVRGSAELVQAIGGTAQSVGGSRAPGDVDLETLMMQVQSDRTSLLDEQLKAQIEETQKRNDQIMQLNTLLGQLRSKRPAAADAKVTRASLGDLAKELPGTGDLTQADFDARIEALKAQIDSLSSSQQMDMLRLQSLSNKRNEAFDMMTNMIKKMQDSRSAIIGNMR